MWQSTLSSSEIRGRNNKQINDAKKQIVMRFFVFTIDTDTWPEIQTERDAGDGK